MEKFYVIASCCTLAAIIALVRDSGIPASKTEANSTMLWEYQTRMRTHLVLYEFFIEVQSEFGLKNYGSEKRIALPTEQQSSQCKLTVVTA